MGNLSKTLHFGDRQNRLVKKETKIHDMFVVNKDERLQLHIIMDDATIIIVDKMNNKIVTVLNARVGQIKRYYQPLNIVPCTQLLKQAEHNVKFGLNLI